ncbi:SHOCT domain-containing protein [Mycolicibacterium sp. HK-90]|uniref:SHOCT domain-containing protein n=1 Tax=Mycolicibacterium sp. HK-90 TaxID=3056937 RepID=UPI002658C279|nr:SHOCT domain-containing protein [Mycolicibacterium sp. HK-90]WKG01428.1 SHOCT domain-containing protein [Mycolicibacterium sp. HK-90]
MNSRWSAPRLAVATSICTLVIGAVGLFVMVFLNAFVLDEYDAYGEVPIPGRASLDLPQGEVTVSLHTMVTGSGSGLPVPPLRLRVSAPDGAADPVVTESIGATTTVNNDARVRVWVMQVSTAGVYEISVDGQVQGYINPRLAFGHGSEYGWLPWLFGGLAALGVLELIASVVWSARESRRARPIPTVGPNVHQPTGYQLTDQAVRLEQLKTIAALRDSGALTEAEFEAEKRRIMES